MSIHSQPGPVPRQNSYCYAWIYSGGQRVGKQIYVSIGLATSTSGAVMSIVHDSKCPLSVTAGWIDRQPGEPAHGGDGSNRVELFIEDLYLHFTVENIPEQINGHSGRMSGPGSRGGSTEARTTEGSSALQGKGGNMWCTT